MTKLSIGQHILLGFSTPMEVQLSLDQQDDSGAYRLVIVLYYHFHHHSNLRLWHHYHQLVFLIPVLLAVFLQFVFCLVWNAISKTELIR